MTRLSFFIIVVVFGSLVFSSCQESSKPETTENLADTTTVKTSADMQDKVNEYALFKLSADLSNLSDNQKAMLRKLLQASQIMDDVFWVESFGDKNALFAEIDDEATRKFAEIHYGPWDRMREDSPFIEKYGAKPLGANFYPKDMTKEEYEALNVDPIASQYSMVTRDDSGSLVITPYHEFFKEETEQTAKLLEEAAELAEDEGFKNYLTLRANALRTDDYLESDLAWMDMKTNMIDFVVGPIENYEDQLFGYRSAHNGQLLIKDMAWSEKLDKFATLLPDLQTQLPVDDKYKQDKIGSNSDLNAYDVVYYGGDCNAAGKNIAINLPNDKRVHEQKGSRRLQLKNAMQAKFDKILVPISDILIREDQRKHIKFDAFFENVMFHEVAHGLGIKKVVGQDTEVDQVMQEHATAIEEGKADILGLWIVSKLYEMGELSSGEVMDNYVTFLAGIFRSVRFGATSSHGKANMIRFYYFEEAGAFSRDTVNGEYSVNFDKMTDAMNSLSSLIISLQGDGDYSGADKIIKEKGFIREALQKDIDRIDEAGIPRDIVFEQGAAVLGL